MHTAIIPSQASDARTEGLSMWASLPGLCCQAAGGDPDWTLDLTAAWLLFYAAADIMDSVQDEDPPEPWWEHLGPGAALSVASGLYFTAGRALNALHQQEATARAAPEIADDYYNSFLAMTSGQYRELVSDQLSLEAYWENAAAKSGAFFELACRSGARLATDDSERLKAFERFGHHLGLLVQLADDMDDIRAPYEAGSPGQRPGFDRSLPVVYAREVLPQEEGGRLKEYLRQAPSDADAAGKAIALLDQSGASLYMRAEIRRHRERALEALSRTGAGGSSIQELSAMLDRFKI
jgi:geranylgeranyl pyrophosphate synthase